jgi:hypothetical protein
MTTLLLDKNLFAKNIMDLLKLSIRLFQRGMRDSGLETCEIGRLDGKSIITRSTLFSKET